ncbi:MAG: iron ABC transporter permease [Spirochaetia bacterium]|nr:iron ABC transporter permease [Spirochaetia bacterium]
MIKVNKNFDIWAKITTFIFILYFIFLIYPLVTMLSISFKDSTSDSFSLAYFTKFFGRKYYLSALFNSFKVTIAVTFFSVIIGVPLAYLTTIFKVKGSTLTQVLILISSVSPPFIGAYSWILLLGRNGVITNFFKTWLHIQLPDIYGFSGIVLVLSLQLFPLIYMYCLGAMHNIDRSLIEASESMGCTGIKKMFKVILPLILPTLLAGSLLVFMRSLSDFGTPMLIGEGYRTIPVLIFNEFISEVGGDSGFAAAISVIVVVIATIIFFLQKLVSEKLSFTMSAMNSIESKEVKGFKSFIIHFVVYIITAIALLPRIYVIYTSFLTTKGQSFTKEHSFNSYRTAFEKLGTSIQTTFYLAIWTILIILIVAVLISYIVIRKPGKLSNMLDTFSMFPFIVPGSVLGIAMLSTFTKKPLLLSGTAIIMIVAFAIRRLPYTIRSSSATLRQINISVEEAAISLGASSIKTFFVITLPMMASGIISGAILSWINILSELSTSVILYTNRTKTMSVAIYTEIIRGNYGIAAALSTLLTIITIISLLIFFKVSGKKEISM